MTMQDRISFLSQAMQKAADNLEFEAAAALRDEIEQLRKKAKFNKKKARR